MRNLRDLVLNDTIAIEKWPQIIDHIVTPRDDEVRLKKLFYRDDNYGEAVLQSLRIWHGYGEERRSDLDRVLGDHELDLLAGNSLLICLEAGNTFKILFNIR